MKQQIGLRVALAVLLLFGEVHAEELTYWQVPSDKASCIVANAEVYTKRKEPVVVIVVQSCPEADPTKALAMTSRNSAVPGIGIDAGEVGDEIIVYTRAELECLGELSIDLSEALVQLPKKLVC